MLEIGPGIGTMTQYLAEAAGRVVAVEIDKVLIPILKETLVDYENVTVINQDVLKLDIGKLAREENGEDPSRWWRICPTILLRLSLWGCLRAMFP